MRCRPIGRVVTMRKSETLTNQKARGIPGHAGVVGKPLVDNKQNEISEDGKHEDCLRDKLGDDAQTVVKVPVIHATH